MPVSCLKCVALEDCHRVQLPAGEGLELTSVSGLCAPGAVLCGDREQRTAPRPGREWGATCLGFTFSKEAVLSKC